MRLFNRHILFIVALVVINLSAASQNEYLTKLNYQTLAVDRIANINGITWVTGNSTYDANHQRFLFQGNLTGSLPFNLYTIDVASGSILFDPVCPAGGTGQILGPQYDNATDTLYSIYSDGTGETYFSWIELATGVVHPLKTIPSFGGYAGSTFDTKNHLYICNSGTSLLVIDASTGSILYNYNFASGTSISEILYNNTDGKLYGICSSSALPHPQFDSITLSTGSEHVIGNLPVLSLPQLNAYTIDETRGKYIFVGTDPPSAACINNYLYVLDINTGNILSKTIYPYAQNATQITDENVIEYSFDNRRGVLYALNWHPPPSGIDPYVNITASANPICPGDIIAFTAIPGPTVVNPSYQWQINGVNTGTNDPVYNNSHFGGNDTVYCIITNNDHCTTIPTDTSNRIPIRFNPPLTASLTITPSATSVCAGDKVHFNAEPVNGGTTPSYQWQINGNNVGTDSTDFTYSRLVNGDDVSCILTSNSNCVTVKTVMSNSILMQVNSVNTSVSIMASATNICAGDSVQFRANPVNGGNSPSYKWQINGNGTETGDALFSTSTLADGDQVSCILIGSLTCSLPASSANTITMTVNPVPVIEMGKDTVIKRGYSIVLSPSISGAIDNYQWTPTTGLDNSSGPQAIATPATTTTYQLTVTSDKGCESSGKRTIVVYTPLRMPDSFTPNGDGRNDIFRIPPSIQLSLVNFSIFNRWGQRIFTTVDTSSGWNGMLKGQPQPAGTYVWEIQYQDSLTGKSSWDSGTFILFR